MKSTRDLLQLVKSTIETSRPDRTLQALKNVRELLQEEDWDGFDTAVGFACEGLLNVPKLNVILVHGIRTDGGWQTLVRSILTESPNVEVYPLGYGFFSVLGLLGPLRGGPVEKIKKRLQDIRLSAPNDDFVIVAHSFGTYITTRILRESTLGAKRLLFCGSVVRNSFEWESLPTTYNPRTVVNDVGTKDIFPVLASGFTFGYGPTGRLGFQSGRVYDRFFNCGHSDFFNEDHVRKYWIPFIVDGAIIPSSAEKEARLPLNPLVGILSTGPWVLFLLLAVVSILWITFAV